MDCIYRKGHVHVNDSSSILVVGEGSLNIIPDGRGEKHTSCVLFVPSLVLSVHQVCQTGKKVKFDEDSISIQDKATGYVVWSGHVTMVSVISLLYPLILARDLGHLHLDALRRAYCDKLVLGLPDVGTGHGRCTACILGKSHREPFPK